ncbi:dephospho-CoA kinase [Dyadobacter fanqingshengii]|uniref:Dephospho-CoA kinase n=1 Tax=Dyadobacter fanqingshengii TaxID=2906443 RepID=A0A9X1P9X8_9BACT|nr:dephospho-CoA kinase [Dyadobacter fanqingshengii]MCF0039417.1 dephospho-CoA kinase [Dyadobacter fanqingshengii]USJ33770.1 dephospho-CoA kinase [Dyadobacter fanqingshengii]
MSLPLQIGITGGIGSGKSVVCKLFSCLGIPVYNADSRAKWLTNHNQQIINRVVALLGRDSYDAEGRYNTSYVSSLVFNNDDLLKKLNAIIHPVVMQDTADWVQNHATSPYVVKEAAIMNKAGDRNSLDYVVVVEAPLQLRVSRILQRDKRSEDEIRAIVKRQVSDEDRKKVADFFINNDEESALIPQVLKLHDIFKIGDRSI